MKRKKNSKKETAKKDGPLATVEAKDLINNSSW
jgi:hypothetical protein